MIDRGMIKWQPFNSIISGPKVINEIIYEKNKKIMPTLSEEQLQNIEKNMLKAYHTGSLILLTYYHNGEFIKKKTKILNINNFQKVIIVEYGLKITFDQIIEIK